MYPQVYVAEMQAEVNVCAKRNTHKRTQREIEKVGFILSSQCEPLFIGKSESFQTYA